MDEAKAKVSISYETAGLLSGAVRDDLLDYELASYRNDDIGDYWCFVHLPVGSKSDVCVSLCGGFNATCKFCGLDWILFTERANEVSRLDLQNFNVVAKLNYLLAFKAVELRCVWAV